VAADLILVSGPAASGKSRWAEHLAATDGRPVVYLATGPDLPHDQGWQRRLQRHRQRRPPHWRTLEVGAELPQALEALSWDELALVDSLGTWVAADLDAEAPQWERSCTRLLAALERCPAGVVLVCEEAGWGVVPATAAGLRFRERLGDLHGQLARRCTRSWLVLQNRALDLLPLSLPVPE